MLHGSTLFNTHYDPLRSPRRLRPQMHLLRMSMPFAVHMQIKAKEKAHLHRPRDAQLTNLTQYILHPRIEITTGILVARRSIEVLLHLRHAAVSFRAEA